MRTERLTTAQALIRFLAEQQVERDEQVQPSLQARSASSATETWPALARRYCSTATASGTTRRATNRA